MHGLSVSSKLRGFHNPAQFTSGIVAPQRPRNIKSYTSNELVAASAAAVVVSKQISKRSLQGLNGRQLVSRSSMASQNGVVIMPGNEQDLLGPAPATRSSSSSSTSSNINSNARSSASSISSDNDSSDASIETCLGTNSRSDIHTMTNCVSSGRGAMIVQRLYDNFNLCDPDGTANCFTEDVVYEDLLLGNSTIVQSREEFRELIRAHPVFVAAEACKTFGFSKPDLRVTVDMISEDLVRHTVGVEWHVEVNGEPLALGRGLSFMKVCPQTGLIQRATDIAEAPWRAVGLLLAPFARMLRELSRYLSQVGLAFVWVPAACIFIFLDRPWLDSLREDIDTIDNFRRELDQIDQRASWLLTSQMAEMEADPFWQPPYSP